MESYVLHIYRRDDQDPQKVVGMIEVVDKGETKVFASLDDLKEIIAQQE